jgi:hypothetical protein
VKQRHWTSPVELNLDAIFDGQLRAGINNQYFPRDLPSLRAKLGQYPSGTEVSRMDELVAKPRPPSRSLGGEDDRLAPAVRVVNETAVEDGLVIEHRGSLSQ